VNISGREKKLIQIGGAVGALILIFSFYISPSISKIQSRKRNLEFNQKQFEEFLPLKKDYARLKAVLDKTKKGVISSKVTKDTFRDAFGAILGDVALTFQAFDIQFTGSREKGQFKEFSFTVEGKELTFREALRLIRRIEEGREYFIIRETRIKPTFEAVEYLNVTFKISVVSAS